MAGAFYPQERQQEILRLVSEESRVAVSDLSQRFGVSEVTIRSDLQALAARELVIRTHGGAVASGRVLDQLSLAWRQARHVQEKARIGRAGAALVSDGDAIFLDSSSTALAIARHLDSHRFLTVVTNSLAVAQAMVDARGVTVVMPGGRLRNDTASLVATDNLEALRRFNIQKGFFGAHGITTKEGLTDVSAEEAEVKRPLVAMCHQVIAIIDASKWGQVGLATFAPLEAVQTIITDASQQLPLVEQARRLGIDIIHV